MIQEAIRKLVEGGSLDRDETCQAMREIMAGKATPAQIAGFVTALRMAGETPANIAGAAAAMRENFTRVEAQGDRIVDTCGTGGDGAQTFNISTASAFVTAGAGVTVAKHGNKSVSSRCGSADVLDALGINIQLSPDAMSACLAEIGIAFLFAPLLHPAMKHAIGPRKELGIRTIFNILGPLSNPAGASYGVLGVYDAALVPVLAEAAGDLGAQHLFVVHGNDGLDEITTTTTTTVSEVKDGTVSSYDFEPQDHGISRASAEDLKGDDAETNAILLRNVLHGQPGTHRDIVVVNAAAAIVAGGKADDIGAGITVAQEAIDSGAATSKLEAMIDFTMNQQET